MDSCNNPTPASALKNFKNGFYDPLILGIVMHQMNGFVLSEEIKMIDDKVKICFLTAGEMYNGAYADIFNELDTNCFIRKPMENQELLKHINEIINFN